MTISCLGPEGTFSQIATLKYLEHLNNLTADSAEHLDTDFYPHTVISLRHTIEDVLHSIHGEESELGIVPIENSTEGVVNATLDTLIFSTNLKIVDEIILPVAHNLFISPKNKSIRQIYSHPQALAQCRKFLAANYKDIPIIPTTSTSEACQKIVGDEYSAAIGNIICGDLYSLKMLCRDIQDVKNNRTKFIVTKKSKGLSHEVKKRQKLTLAFSAKNSSGSLYKMLKIFADRNLNLTQIVSRPIPEKIDEYIFFIAVDIDGKLYETREAVDLLVKSTNFCKTLGNYNILDYSGNITI